MGKKTGAQKRRARKARALQANQGAQDTSGSQSVQHGDAVDPGYVAEAPDPGESAAGPLGSSSPRSKQEGDSQPRPEPRSGDTQHAEQSPELLASNGFRGALYQAAPVLAQNEQSQAALTAPSHGVTESDFRSAIYQAAPGHAAPAPNPHLHAAQEQSSSTPAPPLSRYAVPAPKSFPPSHKAEGLQNTSHLKRFREDDDEERNTPSKHARLRTHSQLTQTPSSPSRTGHLRKTGNQSTLPSSRASVRSPAVRSSPGGSSSISHLSSMPGNSLASLHDLCDPNTLQALLELHGEKTFQVVRRLTGKILDHFSFEKNKFAGANWRRSLGPFWEDDQEEAGVLIHVPIVVQRGNPNEPRDSDMWWNRGPEGMVYMIKFVVALVVSNAKRCKKLMIVTTKHDSNIGELRQRDRLGEYVQVSRFPEEESKPREPCRGRLWFTTYPHAMGFEWKGPRFLDTESTYDYPHGLPYQPLGELCNSSNLEYFLEIVEDSFSKMRTHLALKCEQEMEREEWDRRLARRDTPQQSPADDSHHVSDHEEETVDPTANLPVSPDAEPQKYEDFTTPVGISKLALTKWLNKRKYTPSDEAELAEVQRKVDREEQQRSG